MGEVRVLVVVDHEAVRSWLRRIVERHPGMALCASVATLEPAVTAVRDDRPDVVVLDDRIPGVPAVLACRRLLAVEPRTAVLFLSSLDDDAAALVRTLSGAAGVLLRGASADDVVTTLLGAASPRLVAAASRGHVDASQHVRHLLAASGRSAPLTATEHCFFTLLAERRTDAEIARVLQVRPQDVGVLVRALLVQLHLEPRARPPFVRRDEEPMVG